MPERSPYPNVASSPRFPAVEEGILASWDADKTFAASVESRPAGPAGGNEFVFYDGPPFANGLPHYGHLLTGFVKDAVPRYQTMRGRRVERRFGWDCHGLPAETEAEKQLGVSGRGPIAEYGIGAGSTTSAGASVMRYTEEWRHYVTRSARWVDFDNDYKTMDLPYMESVIWAFKELHDQRAALRGLPGASLLLGVRDTPVQLRDPPGRQLPRPPGSGGDGGLHPRARLGARARTTPACSPARSTCGPGRPPRGRCRPTWRWPSEPDIDYAVLDVGGRRVVVWCEARLGRLRGPT